MNIFVAFFSWTIIQGFLKGLLKSAISFDAFSDSLSTTSCLPNTFHMTAKLKKNRHIFWGTTIQWFLKFGFRVYISQLYCVMLFQIHNSTTKYLGGVLSVVRTITDCLYALYRPFYLEKWNILFCFIYIEISNWVYRKYSNYLSLVLYIRCYFFKNFI